SWSSRPNPSRAITEPRVSLMRNIHLHRTHIYRYGCRRNGPDLSSASIAKWWRVSSDVKAGFCLIPRPLPLVLGTWNPFGARVSFRRIRRDIEKSVRIQWVYLHE